VWGNKIDHYLHDQQHHQSRGVHRLNYFLQYVNGGGINYTDEKAQVRLNYMHWSTCCTSSSEIKWSEVRSSSSSRAARWIDKVSPKLNDNTDRLIGRHAYMHTDRQELRQAGNPTNLFYYTGTGKWNKKTNLKLSFVCNETWGTEIMLTCLFSITLEPRRIFMKRGISILLFDDPSHWELLILYHR
jgi:hypothetical protein